MTSAGLDRRIRHHVYSALAQGAPAPTAASMAATLGVPAAEVRGGLERLHTAHLLVLDADTREVRMASPFSNVPTAYRVEGPDTSWNANCAWDALGIPAALHQPGVVHSRCEQSLAPLHLAVDSAGPEPSPWLFHCLVPAAKWWDDLVFT